jgi:hypothetical protein
MRATINRIGSMMTLFFGVEGSECHRSQEV